MMIVSRILLSMLAAFVTYATVILIADFFGVATLTLFASVIVYGVPWIVAVIVWRKFRRPEPTDE